MKQNQATAEEKKPLLIIKLIERVSYFFEEIKKKTCSGQEEVISERRNKNLRLFPFEHNASFLRPQKKNPLIPAWTKSTSDDASATLVLLQNVLEEVFTGTCHVIKVADKILLTCYDASALQRCNVDTHTEG